VSTMDALPSHLYRAAVQGRWDVRCSCMACESPHWSTELARVHYRMSRHAWEPGHPKGRFRTPSDWRPSAGPRRRILAAAAREPTTPATSIIEILVGPFREF
jgi:hypothetical protein